MIFGFGPLELLFFLLVVALWSWALLECWSKESVQDSTRLFWTLVILLVPVIGALLYLIVRRPQRIRELGG
ncbi:MAG TPA: PLD nuclease N-terminal domain-containing protein [Longimicrobiaceae bacterium]|nr:PLD nuclease N-terminal domain-containing protein [Longimicrobiaceae bacterium]